LYQFELITIKNVVICNSDCIQTRLFGISLEYVEAEGKISITDRRDDMDM